MPPGNLDLDEAEGGGHGGGQHQQEDDRGEVGQAEAEHSFTLESGGGLDFVHDLLGADHAGDKDAGEQSAERAEDGAGEEVHHVEDGEAGDGDEVPGAEAEGAGDAQGDGFEEHEHGGALAAPLQFVGKGGHAGLKDGDAGGEGGEEHHDEESGADEGAHAHAFEDLGQGDEHQAGAGVHSGGVTAGEGEHGGDDHEAGKHGHGGVHEADAHGGLFHVNVLLHVGAVGDEDAHAHGEGEEELAAGSHHGHEGELGEVGDEVVGDAGSGTGASHGVHGNDEGEYEQDGHHDHGSAFHALLHAHQDDGGGAAEEDEMPGHGHEVAGDEAHEEAVGRSTGSAASEVFEHVLDDPAADEAVVGQDDHGHDGVQPAAHFEEAAGLISKGAIGAHRAEAGITAKAGFGHDEGIAEGEQQEEVDEQEDATAVFGSQVGEAPDVAEADGRAGNGEDVAEVAREQAAGIARIGRHRNS